MPQVFVGILVSMALSFVQKAFASEPTFDDSATRGILDNTRDPQKPLPLIYGQRRVGCNLVYVTTTGTNNNYLHIVGVIGEGEIDSIVQSGGVDQIWLDDKLYTSYPGLVYYEFYSGSMTQNVCAALQSATAGTSEAWNDPLRGTAYIYLRLTYDRDKFLHIPDITVEVKGLKVLDTRSSTTAWSDNPALCAYDYLTRSSRRGGMGISTSRIITSSVDSAATYCESKGWDLNIVLSNNDSAIDQIQKLLAVYRGDLIYSQCQFKFVYRDLNDESAVMALTENDVEEQKGISTLRIDQPTVFDTPNCMRIKFPNEANKYIMDDYVLTDSTAVDADGDLREKSIDLDGVTNYTNAMILAAYHLERARVNKTIQLEAHSRCLALEPHDLITVTHTFPGWSEKLFRVSAVGLNPEGGAVIQAVEEATAFYNDTYDMASHSYYDTTIPNPTATVPNVINVSISEEAYYWANRTYSRLKIDFDPPQSADYPYWDHAEIWVSLDAGASYKHIGTATGDFQIDPVEEGQEYFIKILSVNIWGVKEAFADAYSASWVVTGKTTVPSDPEPISVIASGDVVTIITDDITDPDVEGYEVRMGDSWEAGIYVGTYKSAHIKIGGMKPGSFTFWLAPKDNRGRYSATKRSGSVEVFRPSNYTVRDISWSWDYSAGTHTNTTNSTYASTSVLMCTHDGDVLTGTWRSPIYDLSSAMTVRVWGDFRYVFAGSSASWAALPSSNTWASIQSSSKRWYQVVNQSQAGQIESTVYWGNATDAMDNSAKMFNFLAPEFTARYVRVDVTITDPDALSHIYIQTLNMTAAYWST